jgi:hypothetical protein
VPFVDHLDASIMFERDVRNQVMSTGGHKAPDIGSSRGYPFAGGNRDLPWAIEAQLKGGGRRRLGEDAQGGTLAGG